MTHTALDPRDHLLARQALMEVMVQKAKEGMDGERLRQCAVETAEALRDGLGVLNQSAEFGSTGRSPRAPH